jgi:hypothetical protein
LNITNFMASTRNILDVSVFMLLGFVVTMNSLALNLTENWGNVNNVTLTNGRLSGTYGDAFAAVSIIAVVIASVFLMLAVYNMFQKGTLFHKTKVDMSKTERYFWMWIGLSVVAGFGSGVVNLFTEYKFGDNLTCDNGSDAFTSFCTKLGGSQRDLSLGFNAASVGIGGMGFLYFLYMLSMDEHYREEKKYKEEYLYV